MSEQFQNERERYEARLDRIESNVQMLVEKIDRLLIGEHGNDGLIGRAARNEEQYRGIRAFVAWLTIGVLAMAAILAPGWFKGH